MQPKKFYFSAIAILVLQLEFTFATPNFSQMDNYPCYHKHGVRLPKPGSCTEYYVCVNSNAIESSCSASYHFDAATGRCVHPDQANCLQTDDSPSIEAHSIPIDDSQFSVPIHIPKPHHPDEVVPDDTAGNICLHEINGALIPKPDACNQYYVCLLQRPYRRSCPVLLHFNAERRVCQDPALAKCMSILPTAAPIKSVMALELATFSNANKVTTTCRGMPDGILLPHMSSCSMFYSCRNQERIPMRCPKGLHFSVRHQNCNWPSVAKCSL